MPTTADAIQDLWAKLPARRGSRSKYLGKVIFRKKEWEDENPRDPGKKGAGYYAFEVGVSGITTEEYAETLRVLWEQRPDLNQREKVPSLWKHLKWDLDRKFVRLVDYDAPGVDDARRKAGLPALDGLAPPGFDLVKNEIMDRAIRGGRGGTDSRRRVRF